MKKFVALTVALALCLSFAACSSEKEFVPERGKTENYVYENEAFGIKYTADSDWYYYSDEEIASAMGIAADEIFSEEQKELISEAELIYDMYCANLETGATVSVNYENVGLVYGGLIDEKAYLEISSAGVEESVSEAGIEISKNEIGTATVDGNELPCLYVTLDIYGMSFYEVLAVKKCGDWFGVVTVASLSEEELPVLLEKITFK